MPTAKSGGKKKPPMKEKTAKPTKLDLVSSFTLELNLMTKGSARGHRARSFIVLGSLFETM
jgi:hypothetical protein